MGKLDNLAGEKLGKYSQVRERAVKVQRHIEETSQSKISKFNKVSRQEVTGALPVVEAKENIGAWFYQNLEPDKGLPVVSFSFLRAAGFVWSCACLGLLVAGIFVTYSSYSSTRDLGQANLLSRHLWTIAGVIVGIYFLMMLLVIWIKGRVARTREAGFVIVVLGLPGGMIWLYGIFADPHDFPVTLLYFSAAVAMVLSGVLFVIDYWKSGDRQK